jgi:hypothetical protein
MLFVIAMACGTPGLDALNAEETDGDRLEVVPTVEVRFQRAPQGFEVDTEVVLTNVGDTWELVADAWLEGPDAEYFRVEIPESIPGQIKPGQEIVVLLFFEAPAIGRFTAELFVSAPETGSGGITRPLVARGCEDADRDDRCD